MKTLGILHMRDGFSYTAIDNIHKRNQKIQAMRNVLEQIYYIIIEYDRDNAFHTHELYEVHKRLCDLYNTISRTIPR